MDYIKFIGHIQFKDILSYYSILDIVVIPRINARVCNIVTPLKELEAMAMEKVVITSDLPALREMVKPGISGDVFEPDNHIELANKILKYISNTSLSERIGRSARIFVKENHDWDIIVDKYRVLYEKLIK